MDFYEILDQVIDLLKQRGKASYRALQRQCDLDDEYLQDLKVDQKGAARPWPCPPQNNGKRR